MAGLPWYAHDIEAYNRKTRGLSMEQDGAYRRLLDHYYDSEQPLPAPLPEVFRIGRAATKGEQKSITHVLNAFFSLEADGWHNHRADDELSKRQVIAGKRSKAGTASAAKRQQRGNTCSTPEAAHVDTLNIEHGSSLRSEPKRAAAPFLLPDWIPKPAWEGFIEVRKRAKSNPTDHAKSLLVAKLEKLKEQGFSPQECIDAAIEGGWKSFYPPPTQRQVNGSGNHEKRSTTDQHLAGISSLISDIRSGRG